MRRRRRRNRRRSYLYEDENKIIDKDEKMDDEIKPQYFEVDYKDNKIYFNHIHERIGLKNRGTAVFDITENKFYVNNKNVPNLRYYFRNYYVKNRRRYYSSSYSGTYNMSNDLLLIKDKVFAKFLVNEVIKKFWGYTGKRYTNLGGMFEEFYKFKNLRLWKEQGFNVSKLMYHPPSVYDKKTRKILRESYICLNYLNTETKKDIISQILNSCVIEKIPKHIIIERKWDSINNKYDEKERYGNWEKLVENYNLFETLVGYGYSIKAILRYLFNYLTIYENLTIREGLRYLKDYARLNHQMNITEYKRFPKYLKSKHDILSGEFDNFQKQYDEEKFKQAIREELEYHYENEKTNDEFHVLIPKSTKDIKDEGRLLNHCVGSYIDRVVEGKTQILFLRKNPEESLVTLEVRDDVLIQAKGACNRATTKEENELIHKYAKEKNLLVRIA